MRLQRGAKSADLADFERHTASIWRKRVIEDNVSATETAVALHLPFRPELSLVFLVVWHRAGAAEARVIAHHPTRPT